MQISEDQTSWLSSASCLVGHANYCYSSIISSHPHRQSRYKYNIQNQMKSSFPKRDKHHSKRKRGSNGNPKFVDCVLEKSSSNMYIYIYIYLHILEELKSKTQSLNMALTLETFLTILNAAYHVLERSSSNALGLLPLLRWPWLVHCVINSPPQQSSSYCFSVTINTKTTNCK